MAEKDSPHYIPDIFNLNILSNLLNEEVISFFEGHIGWNNKPIRIEIAEKGIFLLRLSKSTWSRRKIENEIAGLMFIRNHLPGIPVPKIHRYGFANESFDFHWILMEFIEGDQLEEIWTSLSPENQKMILKDIAEVYQQLHSLQFNQIGGWALSKNPSTHENEPVITNYFIGDYLFANEVDYHCGKFDYVFSLLKEKYSDLPLCVELAKFRSNHLRQILSNSDPVPIVMFHGDLAFRNCMVKKDNETGSYRLKAVLDWEWVGTRPIYEDYLTDLHEESDSIGNQQIRDALIAFGIDPKNQIPCYHWRLWLCSLEDHMLSVTYDDDPTNATKKCESLLFQLLIEKQGILLN